MAHDCKHDREIENPCGTFGPDQRSALVWFLVVVIGGFCFVSYLCRVDAWMWINNAEVLNYTDYRHNRVASTTVGAERKDPRTFGDLGSQRARISAETK